MKKVCIFTLIILILLSNICYATEEPEVSAKAAIVMDVSTGRILYEKNTNQKLSMASTTKIMTALLALENCKLDDIIKVSTRASHVEGSSIWLAENETITVENALYGLLLNSGNDAAIALAEKVSGSEDKFVELMNKKAKEIGANNTNFTNPHGLSSKLHYTTAYDLALITSYALKNSKFAEIVKTKNKAIPWNGHEWNRALKNHNKLLWQYPYADGVKTGFTKEAGRCLVSSATKDNWQIVAVTLNDGNDWKDHIKMLEYVFNVYKTKVIINKGQFIKTIPVKNGYQDHVSLVAEKDLICPVLDGEEDKFDIKYNVPSFINAPVLQEQNIGSIDVYFNNKKVSSINLKPIDYVKERSSFIEFKNVLKNWLFLFCNQKIV